MPASPISEDAHQTANTSAKAAKVTQKTTAGQANTKGKKNGAAKDSGLGGVMAAVKKEGKMTSKQTTESEPSKSPEMIPTDSTASTDKQTTSPLLDALSSMNVARSAPQTTNEWTRSAPGYSTSPHNLINLGESPPTQPSSYDERSSHFGSHFQQQRGISNGYYHSASPPAPDRRRPLSYTQLDGQHFPPFEDSRSHLTAYANRRASMYSPPARYSPHPPPPHQPQPHFYGAPDADALFSPSGAGVTAGTRGYHCGFDSLPNPSSKGAHTSTDTVILTGFEGGLKAHEITRRGLNSLWSLDGLRGSVCSAKILPWTVEGPLPIQFPLVAMVIHGLVWKPNDTGLKGNTSIDTESLTPSESLQGSPNPQSYMPQDSDSIEYCQTTVEVYSIGQNRHVATLLALPKRPAPFAPNSLIPDIPPPDGALAIQADDGKIVITSGLSGETWIFQQGILTTAEKFICIGKVWTSIQQGPTTEAAHAADWTGPESNTGRKRQTPSILSLNGRYLAYCPPTPSSQVALGALISSSQSKTRFPGYSVRAPPQLPSVNCLVETPGDDSVMKQILQVGTQKFIEGATYLGGQGVQAWNNYWNKSAQSQSPPTGNPHPPQNVQANFPPTHAANSPVPVVTKEPGLISILDLENLATRANQGVVSIHPLATFKVPHGCSFLSFAPSGLALFTASSKGDTQFVWDLMRIQYAKSSFLKSIVPGIGTQSPHVRQIAQFTRMTVARIVDVVWTSPNGERAAMVTEPGTVHILDLPASAFTWPPPRRQAVISKPVDDSASTSMTATSVVTNAASSLWTAARPLVGRRRRSTAGMPPINVAAQATHSTQALAAGISRSVGAATGRMNELRKSGNAKLHLPSSSTIPARGCVRFTKGKKNDSVLVVGGGVVRVYTIKNRRSDRPADQQKASKGARSTEFRLPPLPNGQTPLRDIPSTDDLELTEGDLESRFKDKVSIVPIRQSQGTESAIPQAEIESNAPYQPFHTDRRVTLSVYSSAEISSPSPSASAILQPPPGSESKKKDKKKKKNSTAEMPDATEIEVVKELVEPPKVTKPKGLVAFGLPIEATRLDVGLPPLDDDDLNASLEASRALPTSAMERVLRVTDSSEDIEQIVVTTRRRKGVSRSGTIDVGEEGFFEDDCMVLDFAGSRV